MSVGGFPVEQKEGGKAIGILAEVRMAVQAGGAGKRLGTTRSDPCRWATLPPPTDNQILLMQASDI
jgi:hypothetical protein